MALTTGTYTLGPADGTLLVKTGREGAAGLMGHDLTIAATRWKATVTVDVRAPTRSTLKVTVDADSLEVREASGGAIGLIESQKAEIETIIRERILRSASHPKIRFASTEVAGDSRRASVAGDLTIGGVTRSTTLAVRVSGRASVPRVTAAASIDQTDFGIKPYSILLGALRVSDGVEIVVDVRLPVG
jgi:polyisoprenoid-binding protein YceI